MKRNLRKDNVLWHIKNGERIDGCHDQISGDVTGLMGDVSWLIGDVTGIWGNVSGIIGNVTGIWGNVSGIIGDVTGIWGDTTGVRGDVDDCELTAQDRKNGVKVEDLIAEEKK